MYDFGLTSEQFWELTPAQFYALSERHDARILHEEYGPAQIVCKISSLFAGKSSKKLKVQDFMRHGALLTEPVKEFRQLKPDVQLRTLADLFPRAPKNKKGTKKKKPTRKRG